MPRMTLRPHQAEAVDSVVRHLHSPSGGGFPSEGLRTQVVAATGSGKTLVAVEAARRLPARRVLVLVPTLDLLTQMTRCLAGRGASGRDGGGLLTASGGERGCAVYDRP